MLYALVELIMLCCILQWVIATMGNHYNVKCNITSSTNVYDLLLI